MAVTKLEITERGPLLGGKQFGATGAYDVLKGRLTFGADPTHPRNRCITDIDNAPRTAAGHVEWWADFCLLQPADPVRANRRLLFEVVNRGRMLAFRLSVSIALHGHRSSGWACWPSAIRCLS